jgi:mycothiol synthase
VSAGPSIFSIRPLRTGDIAACHRVFLACASADGRQLPVSAEEMEAWLRQPRHSPGMSWVADMDGRIAGYCLVLRSYPEPEIRRAVFNLRVHPEYRRCGIGGVLLGKLEQTGAAGGIREFDMAVYPTSPDGVRFASRRGFQRAAAMWRMVLDPARHNPGPARGDVVRRTFDAARGDAALLAAMWNRTFHEHFGFTPAAEEDIRAQMTGPRFRPDLVHYLERDGETVGFCRNQVDAEGNGVVEVLGVLPQARSRGYGRFLLDEAVRALVAEGAGRVSLMVVGDNENAIRLYRMAGFEVDLEIHIMRRTLA